MQGLASLLGFASAAFGSTIAERDIERPMVMVDTFSLVDSHHPSFRGIEESPGEAARMWAQ